MKLRRVLLALLLMTGPAIAGVNFDELSGSDLGLGVGARAIGLGGAFTAVADDGSALFWNPAGLARINTSQVFFSGSLPDNDDFTGVVIKPGESLPLTLGFGRLNRLRFSGNSGTGDWSGYPAHLLDISMIDIDPTHSGKIDSSTIDHRFSIAGRAPGVPSLTWGLTYIMVD